MSSATLRPTPLVDSDHPGVIEFAARHSRGEDDIARAITLYYAVRDGYRYDPYQVDLTPEGMKASAVLARGHGWCVTKASLLAAACRACGIPARLGFADVRNHLSTERMRRTMGTDVFYWHGFTEILLEGNWVKATPAFNLELCERFGLLPLEFDGRRDSIYHPFDRQGKRHMEYLAFRGSFDDVPLTEIVADLARLYPGWATRLAAMQAGDFLSDAAAEGDALRNLRLVPERGGG
jgi:transglutaminase-like putative cysteine protease